uniref:Acetyl-coenzyme A carboxylase carboxyl transferase subunit beta n=1 Tax=Calandrinia eremaea TaxID=860309 RepID=A0A411JP50_9CARY|nr:acetyl-CoA carboxylase carboxyltransferase beta subunit [Calandrinia eremaea]QBC66859.1 acetyl-CoA carboxylase carboxyltransferase beta subunit [Calandrinia eremaea]
MTIHRFYFYANRGQESSMKKWWFNSMWSKKELEHSCGLSKSTESLGPIENTREDTSQNDTEKNIHSWRNNDSSSYSNVDHLFPVMDIRNFISDKTFLLRDSKGDSYAIYFDIENQIFEIDKDHSFLSELQSSFSNYLNSSYLNTRSKSGDTYNDCSMYDTKYSWNNHIHNCIDNYLYSQICMGSSIPSGSDSDIFSYIFSYIFSESGNTSESFSLRTIRNGSNLTTRESSTNLDITQFGDETEESSTNLDITQESSTNLDITEESSTNLDITEESSTNLDITQFGDETEESSTNLDITQFGGGTEKYRHLWVRCENCYGLNYKKFFKSQMNICEHCGDHLKMSSSERIELPIDPGTWSPMDEDMLSLDPIEFDLEEDGIPDEDEFDLEQEPDGIPDKDDLEEEPDGIPDEDDFEEEPDGIPDEDDFEEEPDGIPDEDDLEDPDEDDLEEDGIPDEDDLEEDGIPDEDDLEEDGIPDEDDLDLEEEPYKDRIDSYQRETGLTEAVQTGIGQLNGIPVAIGVMDFQFMGGSMGSVVGEKITRLIEYATKNFLPLILVCASGGARMQEGSLSLMQMAKISAALYDYQSNKKLFYISILTSPTTGGVTASFGMLGDIIIAEPNAYIAFAGKRVIEQTLNTTVPEGSQEAEYLFDKGLFDPIVPRNLLKGVLSELFQLHAFFPLSKLEFE